MHIASCQMVVSESRSMVRVAQHLVLDLPPSPGGLSMAFAADIAQVLSVLVYKEIHIVTDFHLCIFAHRITMMPELLKVV